MILYMTKWDLSQERKADSTHENQRNRQHRWKKWGRCHVMNSTDAKNKKQKTKSQHLTKPKPSAWFLLFFSHSVVSSSLWPHGLQHARLPCPSLSPEFAQTHVHWWLAMSSKHLVLCRPLLLIKPLNKLAGKELPQPDKSHTRKLSQHHAQLGKSEGYSP